MPLAYSHAVATNIIAGYLLTVCGAVLALVAGVWFMLAKEYADGTPRPLAYRGLGAIAIALFVIGIAAQLRGYIHLNYIGFFQP